MVGLLQPEVHPNKHIEINQTLFVIQANTRCAARRGLFKVHVKQHLL